jgi:hypothetical protein
MVQGDMAAEEAAEDLSIREVIRGWLCLGFLWVVVGVGGGIVTGQRSVRTLTRGHNKTIHYHMRFPRPRPRRVLNESSRLFKWVSSSSINSRVAGAVGWLVRSWRGLEAVSPSDKSIVMFVGVDVTAERGSRQCEGRASSVVGGGKSGKQGELDGCMLVMNHPGSTFSRDASIWIQTCLSSTGLS